MAEQDRIRMTLTLTELECEVLTRALVASASMFDAVDRHEDARVLLEIWERVAPETTE
jgi:hypothetical protein